jgi:hypothetical protein
MALDAVHQDGETGLAREVDQLVDGAAADHGPVGLQQWPQMEDPDVIEAETGGLRQVIPGMRGVDVVAARTSPDEPRRLAADSALNAALRRLGITPSVTDVYGDIEVAFASAPGAPADGLALVAGTGAVAARITARACAATADGLARTPPVALRQVSSAATAMFARRRAASGGSGRKAGPEVPVASEPPGPLAHAAGARVLAVAPRDPGKRGRRGH